MKRELGFGFCGLVCALCNENSNCIGCKNGGCPEKNTCKNYQCCIEKRYNYCYECADFPCQDSILKKTRVAHFCKILQMYDDNEVLDALAKNENEGIKYHYSNSHLGDYDKLTTVEDVIAFLFR